jgi:hypothetical protein
MSKALVVLKRFATWLTAPLQLILSRVRAILQYPIPHYNRWGLYPQGIMVVACLCFYEFGFFIPTIAIGFLGVVAVVMTIRADRFTTVERMAYALIAVALFVIETRAVYRDRDEHDKQQSETRSREAQNFREIADGLKATLQQNQKQFEATMRRSDAIVGGVADSTKTQTGGDSFAFIYCPAGSVI